MDDADRKTLAPYLEELGATDEEIADVLATGNVGGLALDLAIRAKGDVFPFGEVADRVGLSFEEAARYWRALGFPDPTPTSPRLPVDTADALALMATAGRDLVGEDATLALARVLGATTSRVAQAMVDVFRVRFEKPQMAAGMAYADVVQRYVSLARDMLPLFVDTMAAVLRRHLVAVASATWSSDEEGATAQRDALVGFVDLVGYTALAHTLPPAELARLIDRFEDVVAEAAARHHGRVVKLIGDAAMFSTDDAAAGCGIALDIVGSEADLPPMRAGLAAGGVVSLHGDLFGDVVNLAARLVAVAPEHGVVVSDEVCSRIGDMFVVDRLPPQSLKGFGAPEAAYRVVARA